MGVSITSMIKSSPLSVYLLEMSSLYKIRMCTCPDIYMQVEMSPLKPGSVAECIEVYFTHTPSLAYSHFTNVWSQRGGLLVLPSQSAIWLVLVSLLSACCHLNLADFHYRAMAAPFPCYRCFWQIRLKMTLSHCELDSQV